MNATAAREYKPFLRPLAVNCYAVIIATGKAGRVITKSRWEGKTVWGISWSSEFSSSELCRITPTEYHALPDDKKITSYESGL